MLGVCFFVLTAVSVVFAVLSGQLPALSNAILDGAEQAVRLTVSLVGMTALWCGVMNVLKEAGMIEKLSRVLSPVLRFVFPKAWEDGSARAEITASVSANLLGIGNAATPLALAAMAKLQEKNSKKDTATDDMITLAVLGTSSLDLLPTTLIALRRSAGAARPYGILVPIWITSAACAASAVVLCRLCAWAWRKNKGGGMA